MSEIKQINSTLKEMKAELSALKKRIDSLESKSPPGAKEMNGEKGSKEESSAKQVEVFKDSASGRVSLSYVRRLNNKNKAEFEFYPKDTAKVKDRISVKSGTKLNVFPDGRVVGDGKRAAWKIDMSQGIPLMKNSARIPKDVELYIEERFIKME